MGLMIHSLGELPAEAERGYYVYLLDYGWEEPLGKALRANFHCMADLASRHNAVVLQGVVGSHFVDEVLSYHHVNGQDAKDLLPAILITTRHPQEFLDADRGRPAREAARQRMAIIPLKNQCETASDVVELVQRLFGDIQHGTDLDKFEVVAEMRAGQNGAITDALVLRPTFLGVGVDLKALFAFLRGKKRQRWRGKKMGRAGGE